VRNAAATPPRRTIAIAVSKAIEARARGPRRRHDLEYATYLSNDVAPGSLHSYFVTPRVDLLEPQATAIAGVTNLYLDHRFDLLGSGWVQVRHGMACGGVEGHRYPNATAVLADRDGERGKLRVAEANASEADRIWGLIDPGYESIDWHLDFRSGWRWDEKTWYEDVAIGGAPGADVKVPWELARMQHLPQLAIAAAFARRGTSSFEPADQYAREFRNEILDFMSANPPRFGVNWRSTMDVAIRVANWLVAYDLFHAAGTAFDPGFEAVFRRSVMEHGRHIIENLEWHETHRANHYLADVVGLLFVAAYLPREAEIDAWLAFAVQETLVEARGQFMEDGTNFEASTSYHRLSAELLAYASAVILGLGPEKVAALHGYDHHAISVRPPLRPAPIELQDSTQGSSARLPTWLGDRLERAAEFSTDITKPNGMVPQVGDNDSGRFLKLVPAVRGYPVAEMRRRYASLDGYSGLPDDATYWVEDHLDHRDLVAAINGLFGRPDPAEFHADLDFVSDVVASVAKNARLSAHGNAGHSRAQSVEIGGSSILADVDRWLAERPPAQRRSFRIELGSRGAREDLKLLAYPDFGLYLMRSRRVFLAIRCGQSGRAARGAHAHNDQLGLELNVDGDDWIRDPGTYTYTALPHRRNAYRSSTAHFTPRIIGPEPARLDRGLFVLERRFEASCLYWGPEGFAGELRLARGGYIGYRLRLEDDRVVVTYGTQGCHLASPVNAAEEWRDLQPAVPFSPGYGIATREG
jgi:Heparinase II/III-like protein.